jgi:hypothetical protein
MNVDIARLSNILNDVNAEATRAFELHGPMNSYHEANSVIREERRELNDEIEIRHPSPVNIRKEAIQLAAMAVRLVYDCIDSKDEDDLLEAELKYQQAQNEKLLEQFDRMIGLAAGRDIAKMLQEMLMRPTAQEVSQGPQQGGPQNVSSVDSDGFDRDRPDITDQDLKDCGCPDCTRELERRAAAKPPTAEQMRETRNAAGARRLMEEVLKAVAERKRTLGTED